MKPIYHLVFFVMLLFSAFTHSKNTPLTVELPDLSANLTYQTPIRLNQLLTDTQTLINKKNKGDVFWLAAQLIEEDKNTAIIKLKNNILEKLQWLANNQPASTEKAKLLASFINTHSFYYRHFINLDNDFIRISAENNPLLSGHFTLLITQRLNKIRIIGTRALEQISDFQEHGNVDDYLTTLNLPENTDTSMPYLIQPDATVHHIHNAYWNKKAVFFAPGATLFLGFKHLPVQCSSLNKQIAELLRYLPPLR